VVQFGISGSPAETAKWDVAIRDDPVRGSNLNGTISFATAGPNTRTSQLFINTANNAGLDGQGFAPLGRVVSGMNTVLAITNPTPGSSGGIDQDAYTKGGFPWIQKHYPMVNSIVKTSVATGPC
jgi:peptidyl-prolyl cis-trans isomerase A (cyclophilin A)